MEESATVLAYIIPPFHLSLLPPTPFLAPTDLSFSVLADSLTVEGGGFFFSSASGYSAGIALLLLGKKNKDEHMRVSPWNQYQLVDEKPNPDLQLASTKNQISRGCASFVCFGRTSAGLNPPATLKVGPSRQLDFFPGNLVSDKGKDHISELDDVNAVRKMALKSSLKKPLNVTSSSVNAEKDIHISGHTERKKIQWIDACGNDLVDVREFEPSEKEGSDDEFDNGNERSCTCKVM